MDEVMALYNILEGHCLLDLDMDCTNITAPDCAYCLAKYLVEQGVTVKGAEHGT